MQLSLAQEAADTFSYFVEGIFEDLDFNQLAGNGQHFSLAALPGNRPDVEPMDAIRHLVLTDWCAIWLLTGRGTKATGNRFDVYLQALLLIAAEREQFGELYPHMESLMPRVSNDDTYGEQQVLSSPTHQTYSMPIALSGEFYHHVDHLSVPQRQVQLGLVIWPKK